MSDKEDCRLKESVVVLLKSTGQHIHKQMKIGNKASNRMRLDQSTLLHFVLPWIGLQFYNPLDTPDSLLLFLRLQVSVVLDSIKYIFTKTLISPGCGFWMLSGRTAFCTLRCSCCADQSCQHPVRVSDWYFPFGERKILLTVTGAQSFLEWCSLNENVANTMLWPTERMPTFGLQN